MKFFLIIRDKHILWLVEPMCNTYSTLPFELWSEDFIDLWCLSRVKIVENCGEKKLYPVSYHYWGQKKNQIWLIDFVLVQT